MNLRLTGLGAAAAATLALAGCGQLPNGARQYFVAKYSCPADRVSLADVRDTKPSDVFASDFHAATPPAEVAADAGRLAEWRAQEDARRKTWETWINSSQLFALSGCGHRLVLACRQPGQQSTPGGGAICNEAPAGT